MLKCASFFAGVGGIDLGFKQAGFDTIYANEFDDYAADTFECNYCLLYTSPSPRDGATSRMPSSA